MTFKIIVALSSSLSLAGCQPSQVLNPAAQRYQISAGADGSAWKIDTQTGATWLCTKTATGAVILGSSCSTSKDLNELPPSPGQ